MVKDSSVSIWVPDFVFHGIERSQSETMEIDHMRYGMVLPFTNVIVIYFSRGKSFGGRFCDSVEIVLYLTKEDRRVLLLQAFGEQFASLSSK